MITYYEPRLRRMRTVLPHALTPSPRWETATSRDTSGTPVPRSAAAGPLTSGKTRGQLDHSSGQPLSQACHLLSTCPGPKDWSPGEVSQGARAHGVCLLTLSSALPPTQVQRPLSPRPLAPSQPVHQTHQMPSACLREPHANLQPHQCSAAVSIIQIGTLRHRGGVGTPKTPK